MAKKHSKKNTAINNDDVKEDAISKESEEKIDIEMEIENYKKTVCYLRDERDAFEEAAEKAKKDSEKFKSAAIDLKNQLEIMQNDFANYKRRTLDQTALIKAEAQATLISKFIPVLDITEKALKMITDESTAEGVRMIENQIKDIFTSVGVTEIPALDEYFNPSYHNAVLREKTDDDEMDGKVTEVYQKGYELNGKILRPSVVKVAVK